MPHKIRKLSTSQIKELRQAFDLFDTDRSGGISVPELRKALGALGVSVTENQARQMFAAIDSDRSGVFHFQVHQRTGHLDGLISVQIDFEEFVEAVADSYFKKFSRAEILEAFRRFDRNGDGYIDARELKDILGNLGRNFSSDEIRRMIAQVDRDRNGKISIDEFAALIEREF